MTHNAVNQLFLFHLSQMAGVLNIERPETFPWVIRSIHLLPEGPMAMFDCQWPDKKRLVTTTLRASNGKFYMSPETGHLGDFTTKALQALDKRFERSNVELLKLVGR